MLDQETWDSISGNNLVYELEWVAADRDNNLALFVSYMPAKVPSMVLTSLEDYNEIYNYFDCRIPWKSSEQILAKPAQSSLDEFAEIGLFTYDFKVDHEAPENQGYRLYASPANSFTIQDIELDEHLILQIPRLDCVFGEEIIRQDVVEQHITSQ